MHNPPDYAEVTALLAASGLPITGLAEQFDTALVARVDGEVIGSVALELYGKAALLRSLAVRSSHQGQGIGGRLTQAALGLARQHNVEHVYLLTETAGAFFPRHGFQAVERAAISAPVKQSVEFTTLCPASALAMGLSLI